MDDETALIALTDLVTKYPDITMVTLADVLEACGQDPHRAYETICEMVIPPDAPPSAPPAPRCSPPRMAATTTVAPKRSPPRAARTVTYATPTRTSTIASLSSSPPSPPSPSSAPAPAPAPAAPRGAWAAANMGRRYRVDELCARYTWLSRAAADGLFDKYGDCIELVETEVLEMFPVDEPAAFAGGDGSVAHAGTGDARAPRNVRPRGRGARGSSRDASPASSAAARVADALRERDEDELRRVACAAGAVSMSSRSMLQLRDELWEKRKLLSRLNALASSTRQPKHVEQARALGDELNDLSTHLLSRIRQSEEYMNGCIDLHGLVKDEAVELVESMLKDCRKRRFRVITGKGIHSHNGQAVLRPALEKYLQRRGVKYSQYEDGILTVIT